MKVTLEWLYSDDQRALEKRVKFLSMVEKGVFSRTAAIALGISATTLSRWIARGKKEFLATEKGEEPTQYSIFYADVMDAASEAAATAEAMIMERNPELWRKKGMGRLFGEQFADDPMKDLEEGRLVEMEADGSLRVTDLNREHTDAVNIEDKSADMMEVLGELRKAGISLDDLVDKMNNGGGSFEDIIQQQRLEQIEGLDSGCDDDAYDDADA